LFPFCDSRLVALKGPTFRLLVAPAYLVEELAYMIAMVSHPQSTFDQIGDPLRGPQLRPISVRHGPFGQETNKSIFLLRCQPGWPTWRGLGLQGILPARSQHISPPENTASVTAYASGDFMKGEFLFEERNCTAPTIFQQFRRT
jgi:hypothetical protein